MASFTEGGNRGRGRKHERRCEVSDYVATEAEERGKTSGLRIRGLEEGGRGLIGLKLHILVSIVS